MYVVTYKKWTTSTSVVREIVGGGTVVMEDAMFCPDFKVCRRGGRMCMDISIRIIFI